MRRVSPQEIARRSEALRLLSEARHDEFLAAQVGKEFEVLLEKPSTKRPGFWTGHTENYAPTLVAMENGETKRVIRARAIDVAGERLIVQPV